MVGLGSKVSLIVKTKEPEGLGIVANNLVVAKVWLLPVLYNLAAAISPAFVEPAVLKTKFPAVATPQPVIATGTVKIALSEAPGETTPVC